MEDAAAELSQGSDHAISERRCAALSQPLADCEQCACWQTWPLAATINNGRPDAHFRALLLRGARRFSSRSRELTLRFARLRSVVMPRLRPYSWPDKNAKPTSEAVMPVPTMTVIGSMCFISFGVLARHTARAKICGLVWPCRRPARFVKPDWPRRAQIPPVAEPPAPRWQGAGSRQGAVLARLSAYYAFLFRLHDKLSATDKN